MKITRDDAFRILGVQEESSPDEVRSSYKRLALKWHPDKHGGTQSKEEATHKFQEVSAAYKRLTTNATDMDDEIDDSEFMNIAEMMELFANIFFQNGGCRYPHHAINCCDCDVGGDYYYSDEEYYGYTDDESEPESLDIAHRLRHKYEARKYMPKDTIQTQWRVTEEEALKNARELIAEEELEKRREEKKKTKRKKKKEKKKLKEKEKEKEKGKKEQEVIIENIKTIPDMNIPTHKASSNKENNKPLPTDNFSSNSLPIEPTEDTNNKKNNHLSSTHEDSNDQSNKKNKNRENKKSNGSVKSNNMQQYKKDNLNPERKNRNSKAVDSEADEDAIDTNSAFFLRAASKAPSVQTSMTVTPSINKEDIKDSNKKNNNNKQPPQQQSKKLKKHSSINIEQSEPKSSVTTENNNNNINNTLPIVINRDTKSEVIVDNDQIILQSRQVAVKGNQMAQAGDYEGAVTMFTKAIQLDPNDFRFFGNRSYCYDRIEQYDNALKDGDAAICLAPEWPKGYFRKGRALTGLKRFQEAEQVFQQVLKLDPVCEDAQFELARVRVQILMDMGFTQPLSEQAVRTYGTVQQALEALLAGKVSDEEDLYMSDEEPDEDDEDVDIGEKKEDSFSQVIQNNINNLKSQPKTNLRQSEPRCTAIWVGNVDPEMVTEKQMNQLFSRCGKVSSVRILPHKYCAFVNYIDPVDASAAMEKLQGVGLGNQKLLLRFPNNPPPGSYVPESTSTAPQTKNKPSSVSESSNDSSKLSGPVNGNECYFWRTTGCVFENQCRYKHVRGHKGVDLAKVHAKYGKIPC